MTPSQVFYQRVKSSLAGIGTSKLTFKPDSFPVQMNAGRQSLKQDWDFPTVTYGTMPGSIPVSSVLLLVAERGPKKWVWKLFSHWSLLSLILHPEKLVRSIMQNPEGSSHLCFFFNCCERQRYHFLFLYTLSPFLLFIIACLIYLRTYMKVQSATTAFLCQVFWKHNGNVSLCRSSCNFYYNKWTEIGVIQLILK